MSVDTGVMAACVHIHACVYMGYAYVYTWGYKSVSMWEYSLLSIEIEGMYAYVYMGYMHVRVSLYVRH